MAKEFYTVKVIPHLENETGEYDYVAYAQNGRRSTLSRR